MIWRLSIKKILSDSRKIVFVVVAKLLQLHRLLRGSSLGLGSLAVSESFEMSTNGCERVNSKRIRNYFLLRFWSWQRVGIGFDIAVSGESFVAQRRIVHLTRKKRFGAFQMRSLSAECCSRCHNLRMKEFLSSRFMFFIAIGWFAMNAACKYLAVVCVNLLCYYRSLSGDFVFDDSVAVLKNRDVFEGFSSGSIRVSCYQWKVQLKSFSYF